MKKKVCRFRILPFPLVEVSYRSQEWQVQHAGLGAVAHERKKLKMNLKKRKNQGRMQAPWVSASGGKPVYESGKEARDLWLEQQDEQAEAAAAKAQNKTKTLARSDIFRPPLFSLFIVYTFCFFFFPQSKRERRIGRKKVVKNVNISSNSGDSRGA